MSFMYPHSLRCPEAIFWNTGYQPIGIRAVSIRIDGEGIEAWIGTLEHPGRGSSDEIPGVGYAVPREVQYRANTGLVLERIRPKMQFLHRRRDLGL